MINCAFFRKFVLVILAFQVSSIFTLISVSQAEESNLKSETLKPKVVFHPVEKRLDEELQEIFWWVSKQPIERVIKVSIPTKISKYSFFASLSITISSCIYLALKLNENKLSELAVASLAGGFLGSILSGPSWQFFSEKDTKNFIMECTPDFLKEINNKFEFFLKKLNLSSSKKDYLAVMKKISAFIYNIYNPIALKNIHYQYFYQGAHLDTIVEERQCLSNKYLQTLCCLENVSCTINKRLKEFESKKEKVNVTETMDLQLLEQQLVDFKRKPLINNMFWNDLKSSEIKYLNIRDFLINKIPYFSEKECLQLLDVESNFIFDPDDTFVPNEEVNGLLFESYGTTGKILRVMNVLFRPVRLAIEKRLEEIYKQDFSEKI